MTQHKSDCRLDKKLCDLVKNRNGYVAQNLQFLHHVAQPAQHKMTAGGVMNLVLYLK